MPFSSLGLNPAILKAISEAGYPSPSQVQAESVPSALAGNDLLVSSRTGSGKTAAFMWPALQRLTAQAEQPARGPRVLVLTPTRELAIQVTDACRKYGRHIRFAKAVSVVGGTPYPVQNKLLQQKYEVLVATPGRLLDQVNSRRINLASVELLILDEADRMLDMGFIEDIEAIMGMLPAQRQTLLFSATVDARIAKLAQRYQREPVRIEIESHTESHANIEQRLMYADGLRHKTKLLDHVLRDAEIKQAIVFTMTKRDADELADSLCGEGFAAAALHGDMSQGQRNRTLRMLRHGDVRVLVATDVAARGIDVQDISHVINFSLPRNAEDYVHRIGRTGRAGRSGVAISMAVRDEMHLLRQIERYTKQRIPVHTVAGLEPREVPNVGQQRKPGGKPGQRSWGDKRNDQRGEYRGEHRGEYRGDQRNDGQRGEHRGGGFRGQGGQGGYAGNSGNGGQANRGGQGGFANGDRGARGHSFGDGGARHDQRGDRRDGRHHEGRQHNGGFNGGNAGNNSERKGADRGPRGGRQEGRPQREGFQGRQGGAPRVFRQS